MGIVVDLHKGDRIRPKDTRKIKLKTKDFTIEIQMNHQQLWNVDEIKDETYKLSNTGNTVTIVLDEDKLTELFDVFQVTRGRYYTNPLKKQSGRSDLGISFSFGEDGEASLIVRNKSTHNDHT